MRKFLALVSWRDVLARLPLPMLALAASYGVFRFASMFVPVWVAIIQAAAFELVYIGLAVVRLDEKQQKRARAISLGAVIVSMAYNSLDGLFHRRPALLIDPPLWADVVLSLLHGVPLAALAYLVADLLLHSNPMPENSRMMPEKSLESAKAPGGLISVSPPIALVGRPSYTVDDLGSVLALGEFSRADVNELGGCAASTADRLLGEAVDLGRIERLAKGRYRVV
jgi:hypothetical protein